MELFFEILILFSLVIFQSLFGVGLLLFGTPIFLLLGNNFESTLILILPVSITISLLQLVYHKNSRNYHILEFNYYCLPFLFVFLMINIYLGELINIKLYVSILLIISSLSSGITLNSNLKCPLLPCKKVQGLFGLQTCINSFFRFKSGAFIPKALASVELAITQPSLLESTTTGFLFIEGLNNLSQET